MGVRRKELLGVTEMGSGEETILRAHGMNASPYGRGCCVQVTALYGFQRCAAGDHSHGEAETGLVFSHLQQTPVLAHDDDENLDVIDRRRSRAPTLFVTKDNDCPHILLLCIQAQDDDAWYEIGYNVIDIVRLRAAVLSGMRLSSSR